MGEKGQRDLTESRWTNHVADISDLTELLRLQLVLLPWHLDVFDWIDLLLADVFNVELVTLVTVDHLKWEEQMHYLCTH